VSKWLSRYWVASVNCAFAIGLSFLHLIITGFTEFNFTGTPFSNIKIIPQ